jgi:phosphoserine phosphatase
VQRALSADRAQACVIAYSDHHSDLPLLRWADRAVAVCPSAALAAAATAEGFVIESWA